ncbi:MAG: SRPBCC family protein [Burkholderiales bacterium]|nr:SRPBCC family protein [Opitutaceae bacterium]
MLKIVLLTLAALVVVFLVIVALQPKDFRIERSATLAAVPSVVFAQVNDLRAWQTWSPWARLDPNAKVTFAGPENGVGAAFSWEGNREVGIGTMTIIESRPAERVRIRLDFEKPMKSTSTAEFTFAPASNGGTAVTWAMSGENNFVGRAFCLFVNMDKMVGTQFEQGFENLRAVVETKPASESKS